MLIIKSPSLLLTLQTSSMCLNGRRRGFASATKRLATSMTDPGRVDRARKLLETTEDCLIVPNINRFLPPSTFPNYKRGQIFQQDGAPCHISGSTIKFLGGKKIEVLRGWPAQSPDMNIIEHIWGRMKKEAWRTKLKNEGGALGCLQGCLPCHPRRLQQQALQL